MGMLLALVIVALAETGFASTDDSRPKIFNDFYTETTGLRKAETVATYVQLRTGLTPLPQLETYAAMRTGGDTRTVLDSSDSVYNDNYAFLGLGTDFLGPLPGFRLTLQIGASKDLNSKIHRGGLDGRTGLLSYHEWDLRGTSLHSEVYTEWLYIRRYHNFQASSQFRLFYDILRINQGKYLFEIAPMLNLVGALDAEGLDYNRFAEIRAGMRFRLQKASSLFLMPYYAIGTRWQRPTDYPSYQDFRLLFSFFIAF